MKHDLLILDYDRKWAENRIKEIEDEIMSLGPEFNDAFTQTSETYHDNAPFEIVRDYQNILSAERHKLRQILFNSFPSIPKQPKTKVGIGSIVTVINIKTNHENSYFVAGDWTPNAGQIENGAMIISRCSPIASVMMNKKVGDEISFNKNSLTIKEIKYS